MRRSRKEPINSARLRIASYSHPKKVANRAVGVSRGESLVGTAEVGEFQAATADDRAGHASKNAACKGQRWIVVTGLVPIEKQKLAHLTAFLNTISPYDPQRDLPLYAGYWVERAEVPDSGPSDAPRWEGVPLPFSSKTVQGIINTWGPSSNLEHEAVANDYLDENLTFPLGPLVRRSWGKTSCPRTGNSAESRPQGRRLAPPGPSRPRTVATRAKTNPP